MYCMAVVLVNDPSYKIYVTSEHALLLVKVICTAALHLMLFPEIAQSMTVMKYIINHQSEFTCPNVAFSIIFVAFFINILAELMNIYMLLYQYKVDYCIIHFVALEIIVEIPGIFMSSLIDDKLIKRVFCDHNLEIKFKGSELDFWKDRSILNKGQRIIYRVSRSIYISFIFYFCPFFGLYWYRWLKPGDFGKHY